MNHVMNMFRLRHVAEMTKISLCKIFGHKLEVYEFKTGYYSYDIEQAGYCVRCGYDTHETIRTNKKENDK